MTVAIVERPSHASDMARIAAICRHHVLHGLASFEKVLAHDPGSPEALLGLQALYRRGERWADLARVLREREGRASEAPLRRKLRPERIEGLKERGVPRQDFNSFGARRGNDRVMTRGTFANIRLRNLLAGGVEGGVTEHVPSGAKMTIFDAAERYRAEHVPLIVIAGKEYGTGSSRDWAAKGALLLGVRAVIAESYERIHRSNLLMMGVLPLQFLDGETAESLGLTGREEFSITGVENGEAREVTVRADDTEFRTRVRLDTPREREYVRHGGILPFVLRRLLG